MQVKITQGLGLFVPFFFRWNSVLFEGWVSMSVIWEKPCETQDPCETLSPEGLLRLGCGPGDRNLHKIQSIKDHIPQQGGSHIIFNHLIKNN